jgi:hypothetical protein
VDAEWDGGTLRAISGQPGPRRRTERAQRALVAYLRLLAECIDAEADLIEEHPERAEDVLRRFRGELLDLSLGDAPVEALLGRRLDELHAVMPRPQLVPGTPSPFSEPDL